MPSEGMFESELFRHYAPDKQGIEFRYLTLLFDTGCKRWQNTPKVRTHITTKYDLIFSHLDYDPIIKDMEPILANLDAFEKHGGAGCW
jgi:hypothetical protein